MYIYSQIEKLTEKYELLEKRIQQLRKQSKTEVTSFLDENIGNKLDRISSGVKMIDTAIFTYHHVINFAAHNRINLCSHMDNT